MTNIMQLKPYVLQWVSSWHSQQGYLIPFGNYGIVAASNTSDNAVPFLASLPGEALTITRWVQAAIVTTTNSSSHYWNIKLYRISSTGSGVLIGRCDTSRGTVDAWQRFDLTIGAALTGTDFGLYVQLVKSGSPGAISLGGPLVWGR